MQLCFRPEVRLDILEAREWYDDRAAGLGAEFVRAVDTMTSSIHRFPNGFPKVHGVVRKAVLRRFPYALLYIVDSEEAQITIFACFHHRRDPTDWKGTG